MYPDKYDIAELRRRILRAANSCLNNSCSECPYAWKQNDTSNNYKCSKELFLHDLKRVLNDRIPKRMTIEQVKKRDNIYVSLEYVKDYTYESEFAIYYRTDPETNDVEFLNEFGAVSSYNWDDYGTRWTCYTEDPLL